MSHISYTNKMWDWAITMALKYEVVHHLMLTHLDKVAHVICIWKQLPELSPKDILPVLAPHTRICKIKIKIVRTQNVPQMSRKWFICGA